MPTFFSVLSLFNFFFKSIIFENILISHHFCLFAKELHKKQNNQANKCEHNLYIIQKDFILVNLLSNIYNHNPHSHIRIMILSNRIRICK
jgi:hypothetical protein